MKSKYYLLATSALLAAAVSASAHAQTAGAAAAASSTTIEELVVTAEKREQNLQDIPVAISAFTSEKRDLIGIKSIQDMTNFTPGLNYTSGNDRAAVRGIGRLTNAHPVAVPVAVYDDGIYTTSTVTAGRSPIFTDRVEVLRGPQGTLYGRNSLGGAINVISKRPTEDFYAEVRGSVANFDHTTLEAAMSGPITEGLQFRVAGSWEKQQQGYFKNVVPGMPSEGNVIDQFQVEAQLKAKFSDRLDGWAKVNISGWNNGGGGPGARASYSPFPFNVSEFDSQNIRAYYACAPAAGVTSVVNTSPLGCTNPAINDPRKFASNVRQSVSLDNTYTIATNLTYHADNFDVKYVFGMLNYDYTLIQDNSSSGSISSYVVTPANFNPAIPVASQPCPALNAQKAGSCSGLQVFPRQSSTYEEDYSNFSHEINIASTTKGALQWLGGLYYYREDYQQPVFTTLHDQPQLDGNIAPAVAALGPVPRDFQRRLYDDRPQFKEESYAAYGQIDWTFIPDWKFTAGIRYNHDKLSGAEAVRVLCFATQACGTPPELLGQFTPPVDVTAAVVWRGALPQGVVANGQPGGVTFTPDGFAQRSYDASWDAWTGTGGIQWDPDPDTNVYFRYSRGYLMGGFNSGVTSTLGQFPFTDAEYSDDWAIGVKKQFGRRIQINIAAFYDPIKGYQAPLTVVDTSGGLAVSQSRYLNIPKAVTQGVEVEATWIPIDNLQILLNYAYNDAHVKELSGIVDPADPSALAPGAKPLTALAACTGTGSTPTATNPNPNPLCDVNTKLVQRAQDLSGNSLPQVPKNKVALNVNYTFNFGAGSLTPSVNYIWRDKQYASLFQRKYNEAPSWDQVDLRLTWKDRDNKYSIIAFVNNVADTLGYDGGATGTRQAGIYSAATIAALGLTPGTPGTAPGTFNAVQGISTSYPLTPPRTYGIEFQYRF